MSVIGIRRRSTLPGRLQPSTIDAEGLNFCVRDGNRWNPFAIVTGNRILFRLQVSKHLPKATSILPSISAFPFRFRFKFIQISFCCVLPAFRLLLCRSACRTLTTAHFRSLSFSFFLPWSLKTSARPISNDNLHALPRFQRRPICLLVFQGSHGNLILVVGFTLRCFQIGRASCRERV